MNGPSGTMNERRPARDGEPVANAACCGHSDAPACRGPGHHEAGQRATCLGDIASRVLLVVAALALFVSPRFPYWNMSLAAPQYPRGLSLSVYPEHVAGDVEEIDGLNHYIGMRKVGDAAALERRVGVPAIMAIAACLLIAAAWPSRRAILLVIPAILFPPLFLGDLYWWLRDSGLHLDPHAALSSSIKPFVPQILGTGRIGQFRTTASLGTGCYLGLFATFASLFYCRVRLCRRRERKAGVGRRHGTGPVLVKVGTALAVLLLAHPSFAETLVVEPQGAHPTIGEALARASDGDTIVVRGGIHPGPIVVRKSVHLVGQGRPVLDGGGRGSVVKIEAPGASLVGFSVRASGDTLAQEDAGVVVGARDVRIDDNTFDDVLFGIYLRQAAGGVVRGNRLHGKTLPVPRRGDLIRIWYSDGVTIEGNVVTGGRDAVLWYSSNLEIRDNRVSRGRYGLHFMYCHDAHVSGNRLRDNSVGAFLMYSRGLRLRENWIAANRGVSGYGIGLKDMDDVSIHHNVVASNKVGLFLESCQGTFENNLLADNDKGMVIYPSAMRNRFESNSYVQNGEQVEIEGAAGTMTSNLWRGNFWSDYRGYDADGDGRGDLAYRPARLFERLSERKPALRLFTDSPSAQAIDLASRVFPIFEPRPKFVDESPRMSPLPPPVALAGVGDTWPWLVLAGGLLAGPALLGASRYLGPDGPLGRIRGRVRAQARPETEPEAGAGPGERGTTPAIAVEGLVKRFGKMAAVDHLSFEIGQGETVALWGPNGAGKTTVLRCLLGLLPFEGSSRIMGAPCGPRGRASRRMVGYVPQEVWLHADQTVRETVRFYARLRRVGPDRAARLIAEWGLEDAEDRKVRQLSGGMKQKLALVVALLADPPVLLLDEPTSNLDAHTRGEFADLLERLKAAGKTMLFCTHRQSEVWRLADRVIVLSRGAKVAEGLPEQVREHLHEPAHLCLTVAADQHGHALERLRDGGFDVRPAGSRLWVRAANGRKVEAIEALAGHGVKILDFDLETENASPVPSGTERGTR
jgi:nitrous oxidase accessory protein